MLRTIVGIKFHNETINGNLRVMQNPRFAYLYSDKQKSAAYSGHPV